MKLLSLIRSINNKKILIKFFLIFFMLVIIPVIITTNISYYYSSKVIEKEINAYNDGILKNIIDCNDDILWNISRDSIGITNNKNILDILNSDSTDIPVSSLINIRESLKNFKNAHSLIEDALLYFPSSSNIVSCDGLFNIDQYFNDINKFENYSVDDWKRILNQKSSYNIISSQKVIKDKFSTSSSAQIITIYTSIPYYSQPKACLMLFVNQNSINSIISSYSSMEKNDYTIVDPDAGLIAQYANNNLLSKADIEELVKAFKTGSSTKYHTGFKEDKLFVSCEQSPLTKWIYISAVPVMNIYGQTLLIKNTMIAICIMIVIAGLIISIFLSNIMYRPISELIHYTSSEGEYNKKRKSTSAKNEYALIMKQLDKIYSTNEALKNSLTEGMPFLQENLFYKLINGKMVSEAEVVHDLEKYDINMSNDLFLVISVRFDILNTVNEKNSKQDELDDISNRIRDIINTMIKQRFNCYMINMDMHTSYIVNFESKDEQEILIVCETIKGLFPPEDNNIKLHIGIGKKCSCLTHIHTSYIQSVTALNFRIFEKSNKIVIYDEELMNSYNKLIHTEPDIKPLYNLLLGGECEKGIAFACDVIKDSIKKKLPYDIVNKIMTHMIHAAVSILEVKEYTSADLGIDDNYLYKRIEKFVLEEEYINHIYDVFTRTSNLFNSKSTKKKEDIINSALKYINENYHRDIYLDTVASELNMTTNYLSHFFKEFTGISFPDYLGRVRVEKSKEMLRSTDNTLNQICTDSGFNNVTSFIRTFKKIEGITPGRYREINKHE